MQTILVVEDHEDIQALLKDVLSPEFRVITAGDGAAALRLAKSARPDLILLDLMLPVVTGESVLATLRKTSAVPVIVLTAVQDKAKTVALLSAGANDYLTKPFDIDELVARVHVQLRPQAQPTAPISVGEVVLDPALHQVTVAGAPVTLPKKEFALLETLMRHPHQVFEKAQLYEAVWHEPYENAENTLNVHLSNLRTKLADRDPSTPYLVAIWGIGIRFI